MSVSIETERLVLRPFRDGDEADIARHANSRGVWLGLRDLFPRPYNELHARAWICLCAEQDPVINLAICRGGEVIGAIGIELRTDVFSRGGEIGYWVGEAHWGRGYATEALRAAAGYAFDTLGLHRLQVP